MRVRLLFGAAAPAAVAACSAPAQEGAAQPQPLVIEDQGSFLVGGTVHTNPGTFDPLALTPDGQTVHGDHAYVQYQIPLDARSLPLVMWHGGAQFSQDVGDHAGRPRRLPEHHFPFSDLNNVQIADLLSDYLREKGLDTRAPH